MLAEPLFELASGVDVEEGREATDSVFAEP